ncbi:photosystem I reaction center subunit XI [Oculatella sp. LEGE 06141]|uniref:photosystem I reaction center subunit XI n=1 Tax=Oculatella sp. LEGE 06141 TaxID=1828648 RepID=UPI001D155A57|nr:photosystem I reaction center subunit XI [Oculatella sp. LEGE 06141]
MKSTNRLDVVKDVMQSIGRAVTESNDRPSDPRNREVVYPAHDPQNSNLATPINSSKLVKTYLSSLSAYREGLTPLRRGLEVGVLLGYILLGPFAKLNPLRDTANANLIGLLSTFGMIIIATGSIVLYAASNPPKPIKTISTPPPPEELKSPAGWNQYAIGFLFGGAAGAVIAFALINVLPRFL